MPKIGTARYIHYDEILTDISVKYTNPNFAAQQIFVPKKVNKESDLWPVYDLESFRASNDLRMDGDEARQVTWGWSMQWYYCEEHALRDIVTDRQRRNVDGVIDLNIDTTNFLTDMLLVNMEIAAAQIVTNPANNGGSLNANWTSYATASPKTDIVTGANTIFTMTGRYPNVIVIPATVARKMLLIEEIKEERKYVTDLTQSGLPNPLWGLRVIEVQALRMPLNPLGADSSAGDAGTVLNEIWGDNVWIGYVSEPGLRSLTYGVTFFTQPRMVRTWREESRKGDWIEVSWIYGLKVIAKSCGYLLQSVFTP